MLKRAGRRRFIDSYWPERLASLVAVAGVAVSILVSFQVRVWEGYGSDFKTMYGSIVNLVHGRSAYDMRLIAAVFDANGVVQPSHWYAHAPVYPPFTLALMSPLAALPMVPAIYVWFGVCAVTLAAALASLARAAGEQFGLPRPWRMALIALGAAWPLTSFGLEMENVSVVASALCILAITAHAGSQQDDERKVSGWLRAGALAVALLLKPHLAIWVVIGLVVIPESRGRRMAVRGAVLASVMAALLCLGIAMHGDLGMQLASYQGVLHAELTNGSMSGGNHELMAVSAQILSLDSLVSYFPDTAPPAIHALVLAFLAVAAGLLLWASKRMVDAPQMRYPLIAAWCVLGLLLTYHRAHDGLVLLLLLPWLMARLHSSWRDATAWSALSLLFVLSAGLRWETLQALAVRPGLKGVAEFVLYRQAPCAALLLAALLFGVTLRSVRRERTVKSTSRSVVGVARA